MLAAVNEPRSAGSLTQSTHLDRMTNMKIIIEYWFKVAVVGLLSCQLYYLTQLPTSGNVWVRGGSLAVDVNNPVDVRGTVDVGNTVAVWESNPTVGITGNVGVYGTVSVGNQVDVTGTVDVGNTVDVWVENTVRTLSF